MKKIKHKKTIIISAIVAVVLLFIGNASATVFLLEQNHKDNSALGNQSFNDQFVPRISFLISRAISQVNKPAVIDPTTNNVYLPDAKLVLPPAPLDLGQVVYSYSPSIGDIPAEVQVADANDISKAVGAVINAETLNSIFSAVPEAQSCTRGISIYYQPFNGLSLSYVKKLNNGRTAYFYTESLCKDSDFLDYIEQINSY